MANPSQADREVAFESEFIPYRAYTDGSFERLDGETFLPPSHDPSTGVTSKDVHINPNVTARLYLPTTPTPKLPLLIYYHGGGFCIETPFSPLYHPYLNSVSAAAPALSVSVHYRRAPEHPVDVCYEDSFAALQWAASHLSGTGPEPWLNERADLGHVYLGGDSAGGNIVHHVAMRAGREGVRVEGIVLAQPYFWGKERLAMDEAVDSEVLKNVDRFWHLICPEAREMGGDDPRVNVVKAGGLEGLGCRRVFVCVAEKDMVRGRGWEYYEALRASAWRGVVEIWDAPGEGHVFQLFKPGCDSSTEMMRRVAAFIRGD